MGHEMDTRVSRLLLFVSALAIAGMCWGCRLRVWVVLVGSIIIIIILIPAGRFEGGSRTHTRSHMYFTVSQLVRLVGRWVGQCQ
jgi:hypothetical protein